MGPRHARSPIPRMKFLIFAAFEVALGLAMAAFVLFVDPSAHVWPLPLVGSSHRYTSPDGQA